VKEEPIKEEPIKEEPVKEEPVKEEPVKEEPVKEEPVKEEPIKEELIKEEPVKEEPVKEEPVKEEPVKEEPMKEEEAKEEAVKEEAPEFDVVPEASQVDPAVTKEAAKILIQNHLFEEDSDVKEQVKQEVASLEQFIQAQTKMLVGLGEAGEVGGEFKVSDKTKQTIELLEDVPYSY